MTLAIHLVWCTVRRCRIARILKMAVAILLQLLDAPSRGLVLTRNLSARLVSDRWELNRASSLLVSGAWSIVAGTLTIRRNSNSSCALLFSFALVLFLLLPCLPFLSDLLEFCIESCVSMRYISML